MNYLLSALFAADVKAVLAREDGRLREFPPSLWIRPGIRATLRSGELPTEFRIGIEGHKAETGKHRILLVESDVRRLVRRLRTTRGRPDVEVQTPRLADEKDR